MLMIVMSLAISLVPGQFLSIPQQTERSTGSQQKSRTPQENRDAKHPTVLNVLSVVKVEPIALPPGDNSWAVQIVSRGGFSGSGRGDLTLTSDGTLIWNGPDGSCTKKLNDETLNVLAKVVRAVEAPAALTERSAGMCADCFVTAMLVQQANGSGVVGASSVIWDDVSQAKVRADLLTVYETLMAQRGCKLQ